VGWRVRRRVRRRRVGMVGRYAAGVRSLVFDGQPGLVDFMRRGRGDGRVCKDHDS